MKSAFLLFLFLAGLLPAQETVVVYLPQLVDGGGWSTTFSVMNLGLIPGQGTLRFFAEDGSPLPLTMRGTPSAPAAQTAVTVPPHGMVILETAGTPAATSVGWAEFASDPSSPLYISGFVRQVVGGRSDFESAVPAQPFANRRHVYAFNNRGGFATGFAVMNASAVNSSVVGITIRDEAGQTVATSSLTLPPRRHTSFALADQIPATRAQSGTIEFNPQFDGWFLVLGLRFNPTGPFTTMQAVTP